MGVRHLYEIYKQQLLRKSIDIPVDAFFLLSVGELNANKNHAVVIRAIAKLHRPNIHYAIAGVGDLHDDLLNLAVDLGVSEQVHQLGFRNDVDDLYQAADVCVFPSIREGLGLAAIEGMASGLPLVCADNRGTRDYAIDGVNAIVCDYSNADSFADAIIMLCKNRSACIKIGENIHPILERYSQTNIIDKMKMIYTSFFKSLQK